MHTRISLSLYFITSIIFFQIYSFNAYSWMPRLFAKSEQEKISKEYAFNSTGNVKIKNINGSITIKTSATETLTIQATKQGTPEEIKNCKLNFHVKNNEAVIATESQLPESNVHVNYEIIVPITCSLKHISTQKGSIYIEHFKGKIGTIQVDEGNITLSQIFCPINSVLANTGNITIINPHDALHNISVNKGNIDVTDSINTVIAKTNRGNITIKQKIFHEPFILFLEASRGNISLYVPQKLNAHVRMLTQKGTILSTFAITLRTITMKINAESWNQLRRNIEGIIGNGGAPITIDVAKGNIKLDIY